MEDEHPRQALWSSLPSFWPGKSSKTNPAFEACKSAKLPLLSKHCCCTCSGQVPGERRECWHWCWNESPGDGMGEGFLIWWVCPGHALPPANTEWAELPSFRRHSQSWVSQILFFLVVSLWRRNAPTGLGTRQGTQAKGKLQLLAPSSCCLISRLPVLSGLPSLFSNTGTRSEVRSRSEIPPQKTGPGKSNCFLWVALNLYQSSEKAAVPAGDRNLQQGHGQLSLEKSQLEKPLPLQHLSLVPLSSSWFKIKLYWCCSTHPAWHFTFNHLVWQDGAQQSEVSS